MRTMHFVGLLVGVCGLGLALPARADAPPMPPCPPGWEQVDAFSCREPIACPPGWKLDVGPVCVPWECQKDADCNWKGIIPCMDASVCASGSGRAVRVCETGPGGLTCPSGLSCQKRKLCGSFRDVASRQAARFTNWTPTGSPKAPTAPVAAAPSAAAPASAATDSAPLATAPVSTTASQAAAPPSSTPRRASCHYAAGPAATTGGPFSLWLAAALWGLRRRARAARLSTYPQRRGAMNQ